MVHQTTDTIDYRSLTEPPEFEAVAAMEQTVWGMTAADTITAHTLRVIAHTGGCVLGAFSKQQMVGCAVGFATRTDRLWSHFAAIHPDYQGQGIGRALKWYQKAWALEQGYRHMSWTFDPLQSANANFNFGHLGVTASVYHVNFYGVMNDSINAGMPSDRLEVLWDLTADASKAVGGASAHTLLADVDGQPKLDQQAAQPLLHITIPSDFNTLKQANPQRARQWQMAVRDAFQWAFAQGYSAVNFERGPADNAYILQKRV